MKYLFINVTAGFGSTGRLAAEKCRELMEQGHSCVLAYGRDRADCGKVPTVRIGDDLDTRCHALKARLLDDVGLSSKLATRRFVAWAKDYDPDVIWLHNLHGYYIHLPTLFDWLRSCGKVIRWTLHDCWAFTGHCAYFDYVNCDRWKTQCCGCPQKKAYPQSLLADNSTRNYRLKKALFTGIPKLTLQVPSNWLKQRVEQSFLREYPVEVVYNTVDRTVFRPNPGNFCRDHGLEGRKVVLGVASVWEERKGLKDFAALAGRLPEDYRIVLIGLSLKQIKALPEQILGLPRTASAQELAEAYSEAHVFVNPSAEETFGMTTLEARCCGTPAIVYKGTACEEIVADCGGIAVEPGAEQLCRAILALNGEEML